MNLKNYDQVILDHYKSVAAASGDKPEATMADARTRELETRMIGAFYQSAIEHLVRSGRSAESLTVADLGCGNGYTLEVLRALDERPQLIGFEYSPDLRAIAAKRFEGKRVEVRAADIRKAETLGPEKLDIVICQRVIINLLDLEDQKNARDNIVAAAAEGSYLLFLECFNSALRTLNLARQEFGMSPIPPAHHNLYLEDDFFDMSTLARPPGSADVVHSNFLSTHYFVTRVLHPLLLGDRPFLRNSLFTSFMSQALAQNIGDFSPIRACGYTRVA
jgi:SAM-dependent methyltransferase